MNLNAKILLIIDALIFGIGLFSSYFLIWPQLYSELFPKCPASCDDGNSCTIETCSEATAYKCEVKSVPNCCGNQIDIRKRCDLSLIVK